jgi:transcriptional regulator with XRE-family HTH domain
LPILNTINDHIKTRRLELKLLQREVAEHLGVKTDTILNWEHCRTKPTLRSLPRVIAFLGYDPSIAEPKTLGEKVLQYRKSQGLSQKELARQMGIDPTTLARLERNEGRCLPGVLRKVIEFLQAHA